ncbi:SRPBCC family protein [soil metagenome]
MATEHITNQSRPAINVGLPEREMTLAAGAVLALAAMNKPFTFRGLVYGLTSVMMFRRAVTGHCPIYSALDVDTRKQLDRPSTEPRDYSANSVHIEQSVPIKKPAADLYAFWRNLENLPKFMEHVKDVHMLSDGRSHWRARGPLGFNIEWDAEIINDELNRVIAWRSVGEAEVDHAGSVRFIEMAVDEAEVRVTMDYIPPAGQVGHFVAKVFGEDPATQCRNDLLRLKQILESEVVNITRF